MNHNSKYLKILNSHLAHSKSEIRNYTKLRFPNAKYKIGKTCNPTTRKNCHKNDGYSHFFIIDITNNQYLLDDIEKKLIDEFGEDKRCDNIKVGGAGNRPEKIRQILYLYYIQMII